MTDHQLEDVDEKLSGDPIYKETQLLIDFRVRSANGNVDLTGDKLYFSGENLTTGNDVFDVETTHQDETAGITRAKVSPSEIDESGVFVFELRWDKGDTGDTTDRVQWKQEVKQDVKT